MEKATLQPMHDSARADWLPSILMGTLMLASSISTFFLPVYLDETLGFSGAQIGLLYALQAMAGILAVFPAGFSNDRITSRTLVIASLFLLACCYGIMSQVDSYWPFVLVLFGWSVFYQLFRMSMDVQVLKTDRGDDTGARVGLYQAWRFGGIGIGTIMAGYLIFYLDFQLSFLAASVLCLLLILPSCKLRPTKIESVRLLDYRADFLTPRILFFALWLALFATHWGAEYTSYALFLKQDFGLSKISMGWYMSGEFAAILLTTFLVGRKLKGNGWMVPAAVAGLAFSGIGHIGMTIRPIALSFAFRSLHGVGDGLIFLLFYVGIARLFKVERLGGNAGLMNLATMVGMVAGSLIFGPMGEKYGYQVPFWVSGVICLVLIVPLVFGPARKTMA